MTSSSDEVGSILIYLGVVLEFRVVLIYSGDCMNGATMRDIDLISKLFLTHATGDHDAFHRVAQNLIHELTVRNRHSEAKFLQDSLEKTSSNRPPFNLQALPIRQRRDSETLINFVSRQVRVEDVQLAHTTRTAIDRLLLEQRRRRVLEKHGLKPESKVLFWGPPGCGKTMTAAMVATELAMPLGIVRLSTLITSYVGETAANLQRVFTIAAATPMVLLIDEIDSIGKNRDDRNDVGELKRVVNSLLQAMDFFSSDKSVLIAASNHQYLLDEAIWRRFDDVIEFPMPDGEERRRFLATRLSGVEFVGSEEEAAKLLSGLSFADIESVLNAVVKRKVLEERLEITLSDVTEATRTYRDKRRRARMLAKKTR